jgi:tRNA (guanine-N7-)-methyltransferase
LGKDKLRRFAENDTFACVVQPRLAYPPEGFHLKGCWNTNFFKNNNPIVLELGCGRGEYTVGLANKYKDKNFIGVDIKGARMWRGAKTAVDEGMSNVGFLRIAIDQIAYFFGENEVSEVWITFPDPQPQESRERKRLTSINFIDKYRHFLKPNALIHLKTDDKPLYEYTLEVAKQLSCTPNVATDNLYNSGMADDILEIKTTYEKMFLAKGMNICYLNFNLKNL